MRNGGGSQKGASYERKICQRLSLWVSKRRREDCFWRSAMSGGRATLKSRKKSHYKARNSQRKEFGAQAGDITATHVDGYKLTEFFVVDAKHYKSLEVEKRVFGGVSSKLEREWKKLLRDAEVTNKIPLMICRQNFQPTEILCTSQLGYRLLSSGGHLPILCIFPPLGMRVCSFREMLRLDWDKIKVVASLKSIRLELE